MAQRFVQGFRHVDFEDLGNSRSHCARPARLKENPCGGFSDSQTINKLGGTSRD